MGRVVYILVMISLALGLLVLSGCGEKTTSPQGVISNGTGEEVDLPPEGLLWRLFSLETEFEHEQYWDQYEGKRVQWTGRVHNLKEVDNGVAVSMDYVYEATYVSSTGLHAGVILLLDKSQALSLAKGYQITYTGYIERRLSLPGDTEELLLKFGYGVRPAILLRNAGLID